MKLLFAFITFIAITASGCITINMPEPSGTANTQPIAYIDSIQPQEASIGESIIFTGHGTDTDGTIIGYQWRSNLDGVLSTTSSFKSATLSSGTHTIYLRVLDNRNQWSQDTSSTITIMPTAVKPVIEFFTISPASIVRGGAVELRWSATGAKTVSIDNGIGQVAASGARAVFPVATTLFTLTASNEGGTAVATASVTVITVPEPSPTGNPVISFTAQHIGGTSWQLNWNVLNAKSIVIEPEIGPVSAVGSKVVVLSSGQTKKYRLTATNDWGWAYWEVILVTP